MRTDFWSLFASALSRSGRGATDQRHSVHRPYTKKQKKRVGWKEKRKRKHQRKAQLMGRRKY